MAETSAKCQDAPMSATEASVTPTRTHNGTGITSLVFGILASASIIAFWNPTGLTYTLAIIGLAFGLIAAAQSRHIPTTKGLWITGITLSVLTFIVAQMI